MLLRRFNANEFVAGVQDAVMAAGQRRRGGDGGGDDLPLPASDLAAKVVSRTEATARRSALQAASERRDAHARPPHGAATFCRRKETDVAVRGRRLHLPMSHVWPDDYSSV